MPELEFLIAEYNYLSQNAFAANEDRIKVFNYYLAAVGTLIASGIVFDLNSARELAILGYVFIVLGILGIISIFTLLRLRSAWTESVMAMNQIKQYVIQNSKSKNLASAFRWGTHTIPDKRKLWSVAYLNLVTVALVSSISFSIGLTLLINSTDHKVSMFVSIAIAMIAFVLENVLWWSGKPTVVNKL